MKTQTEWKNRQFANGKPKYCYLCKTEVTRTMATVDHIKPLGAGGRNQTNNFKLCCFKCNQQKGDRVLTQAEIDRLTGKEKKQKRDYSNLIAAIKKEREKHYERSE